MSHRCRAKNKQGKTCGGFAQGSSLYCYTHDPKRAEERHRARQRGGRNRRQPESALNLASFNLRTTNGLLGLMDALMKDASTLGHSLQRTQALSRMAKVQSQLVTQYTAEKEKKELDRRLKKIDDEYKFGK